MPATLAIIADDLTGALDSAAPFAARGLDCVAALDPDALDDAVAQAPALVTVNTLTRHRDPAAAAAIVARAAARCAAAGARIVLKKIDSRMRGQVAAEVLSIAGTVGARRLVIAPAVPAQGRIVAGGIIHGAGVPASGIPIRPLLQAGAELPLTVPDSRTEAELDALAAACLADAGALPVGAHGLATALARQLAADAGTGRQFRARAPGLAVVGSQDPATAAQVAALALRPGLAAVVDAPAGVLPPPPAQPPATVTVLRSIPGSAGAEEASMRFATGAVTWWQGLRPRTALATGGDTAAALLAGLGCRVLKIGGEAAPGIPWLRLPGDVMLLTKSGGFGHERVLLELLDPETS